MRLEVLNELPNEDWPYGDHDYITRDNKGQHHLVTLEYYGDDGNKLTGVDIDHYPFDVGEALGPDAYIATDADSDDHTFKIIAERREIKAFELIYASDDPAAKDHYDPSRSPGKRYS